MITREYHGHTITFDEEKEKWYIVVDGRRQEHSSFKIVQNYVDRLNKKAFKRIPVFIEIGYRWNRNGGQGWTKGVITSVGVDGTVFVVKEGEKHAEHCGVAYEQTPENKKKIEQVVKLNKDRDALDEKIRKVYNSIKNVDFNKIRKEALGEKFDE